MKVTGIVVVDLRTVTDPGGARWAIWNALADAPVGVDARLRVPAWSWWATAAIDMLLQEFGDHLASVTIEFDVATVRRWVLALRRGSRHLYSVGKQ